MTLWEAIQATHTTYFTGLKPAAGAEARHLYAAYRQGRDQSLTDFKEKYKAILRSINSLGLDAPSKQQHAAGSLAPLNEKFGRRRLTLENNEKMGGEYPTTLFEAYRIISELADLPSVNATLSSTAPYWKCST